MAGLLRTINHPDVEIREIDKSQYTPAIVGTFCAVQGYADKGVSLDPVQVTDFNDLVTTFGQPTNEAERYFHYTCREVLNNNGTLVATKLPYANQFDSEYRCIGLSIDVMNLTGNSFDTWALSAIVSGWTSASVSGGYAVTNGLLSISGSVVQESMSTNEYDALVAGIAEPGYTTTFPNDLANYDFLIVNDAKSTVTTATVVPNGIFVAIVDPVRAMSVQRMIYSTDQDTQDAISGIIAPGTQLYADNSANAYLKVVQWQNEYRYSSFSEDLAKKMPTITFDQSGDYLDKTYSHHVGIIVCTVFPDDSFEGKMNAGILESFVGSLHVGKRSPSTGQSIYIGDIVNANSRYIKMYYNAVADRMPADQIDPQNYPNVAYVTNTTFPLLGFTENEKMKLIQGAQVSSKLATVWEKISNIDALQIDLVVDGGLSTIAQFTDSVSGGMIFDPVTNIDPADVDITSSDDVATWRNICDSMIEFCGKTRKDCMAILDVPRHLVLYADQKYIRKTAPDVTFSNSIGPKLRYVTGLNSSYAALYSDWMRTLDSYVGINFWLPQSAKMAGVYVNNDRIANIWDAPAGLNRGVINGINDLAFNPNGKSMDRLYEKSINYARWYPLDGYVAEGQKTTQIRPTAFDRVNVRRLFLRLERLTYQVCRYYIYQPNNLFTRRRLVDQLTPVFQTIKQQGGIYDYMIKCDDQNNTPDVVDKNELKIAILIKPVKTVEFILVDFVATKTGASFTEVMQEL